jgi:ketosteroid isomerase-like protein
MKKNILLSVLLLSFCFVHAQDTEAEIRNLEQREVQAVLTKDSAALLKLWDKNYTVNSPDNVVVIPGKTTLDRPVLRQGRSSFTRDIEHVIIKGNFAISMGSESVVPVDEHGVQGTVVKRRFTNIWEKQAEGWKLVARHANVICKPN